MDIDLPYCIEYAKSGRSSCKQCKDPIVKDSLRMGIMIQSPTFDGKIPMWYHFDCFLKKKKIFSITEIAKYGNLRWEDQKLIQDKSSSSSKGAPSENGSAACDNDFSIEYAKSSRSTCKKCAEKILKGEIRVSKLASDSSESRPYGPVPQWRHLNCFVEVRKELNFLGSGEELPGFNSLSSEDQEKVKEQIVSLGIKRSSESISTENSEPKKPKKSISAEEIAFKKQNQLLYDIRDQLKDQLKKVHWLELLEYNKQYISHGDSNILDNLSDCMMFGALKKCPECEDGIPRFKNDAYRCSGNISEWTKCQYVSKFPNRKPFEVPKHLRDEFEVLQSYKYVPRERLFPPELSKLMDLPLNGFKIVLLGKLKAPQNVISKKIEELGGTVSKTVNDKIKLCISTESEVRKNGKHIQKASKLKIHIVSENFLVAVQNGTATAIAIKENQLCGWGDDPVLKFGIKQENAVRKIESESSFSKKEAPKTMKVTVKGAAVVDPDSGLGNKCHVCQKQDVVYNVVLGKVDISKGTNTYYKLQILESNKGSSYWLFRSWGRVGTTIGNSKCEKKTDFHSAKEEFKAVYLERTGNEWKDRQNFKKKPGHMYPLDIDYGQESGLIRELKPGANSKLCKPVQELICLIFDIEAMKEAMVEFEIDLKKMPLGKLSRRQIESAYSVLNDAQQICVTGCNSKKILDASNRFYTLIPHDFGLKTPPLLDNEELIKSKIAMLDSLLEIEIAYNLLKGDEGSTKDPVDEHYERLATDIEVLDKNTKEYEHIKTYLHNTHAKTHDQYSLKLNEVFKINRHHEKDRYKKFESLHNKKLLWHGSRLTNFVGILSQGLRIAPPEAPATGYMFGKGVYFADMVSKSANYCYTTGRNATGFLLLCEVALGNMYEKLHSEYVTKLPPNKHSTKGLGLTIPDPKDKLVVDGVEIPYGKPVPSGIKAGSLLYNEYIVYDVNQINIKYLLNVNFKWKY